MIKKIIKSIVEGTFIDKIKLRLLMKKKNIDDLNYLNQMGKLMISKDFNCLQPKTFNEKLQAYKIYSKDKNWTNYVDKYEVRKIVSEKIGEEYLIPLLAEFDSPSEIDFDKFKEKCVFKVNHDSGGVCIFDPQKTNVKELKQKLNKHFANEFSDFYKEYPYRGMKKRIIVEKFIGDTNPPIDYKFFCFNGEIDSIMVCFDRGTSDPKFYFTDESWNVLPYNKRALNEPNGFKIAKPDNLSEMYQIVKKLAQGFPFVRIDMYNIHGTIYFGEFTFFPDAGFDKNILKETDLLWGEKLILND